MRATYHLGIHLGNTWHMHCCECVQQLSGLTVAKGNQKNSGNAPAGNTPAEKNREKSGNREESVTESNKDAFGKQSAARSGTTPLAGDTSTSNDKLGPGGEEGIR